MRKTLMTLAMAICLVLAMSAVAAAQGGGGGGGGDGSNACPPSTPGFPDSPTPGCGHVRGDGTCEDGIDNDEDGKKDRGDSECRDPDDGCENGAPGCPDEEEPPPPGGGCPPATGPISGIVQQISDEIRAGGGAPLADVIDTINCEIIVGVLGLNGVQVGV